MKKVRKLVALAVVASVTLSSALPVFAQNAPGRFATGTRIIVPEVVPDEVPEVVVVTFPDLQYTRRIFVDNLAMHRGYIPVLTHPAFASLNAEFLWNAQVANPAARDDPFGRVGTFDGFWADFTVEYATDRDQRFAVITQTLRFGNAFHLVNPERELNQEFVFYIDKATNTLSTEAAFTAFLEEMETDEVDLEVLEIEEAEVVEVEEEAAEEPEEEVEEVEEYDVEYLVPVIVAEEFGFVVYFDEEENLVEVMLEEELVASFVAGESVVMVFDGDEAVEFELSSETFVEDGMVYVPVDFFTEVLGIALEVVEEEDEEEDEDEEEYEEEYEEEDEEDEYEEEEEDDEE